MGSLGLQGLWGSVVLQATPGKPEPVPQQGKAAQPRVEEDPSIRCTGSISVKTHCPIWSGLCAMLRLKTSYAATPKCRPKPCALSSVGCFTGGQLLLQWFCSAVECQVSMRACWLNGFHHYCIPLAPQGPGLGFEAKGFLFVFLRMFYSFIPNRIQFSSLLRLWLSAILK